KVELIQSLLRQMPVQAILPGPNELALGLAALDPTLPYLVSNAEPPAPLPTSRLVTWAGRRVALLGYLSPRLVYQGMHSSLVLQPVDAALLEQWRAVIRQDQAAVLLFRGDDQELEALARSGLFTQIIAGNPSDDDLHQVVTRTVAGQVLPQVPTKGQGVLRLALGAPQPPTGPAPEVDWLSDKYPDDPAALAALAHYDAQVKDLFLRQVAEQQAHRGESPYAGAQACQSCHPGAYAAWQHSLHAQAVPTLERVGKAFDPECLQCHVVGLHRQGFISQQVTPKLAGVQCENCHGPARAHAAQPAQVRPVPPVADGRGMPFAGTCRTCHQGSHSPRFAFEDYWPRIQHGLDLSTPAPAAEHGAQASSAARVQK
ncbi:MAG TPA: multiheme c-type cytochrome, partial [bacterium]|nr:multiheme c-type cytochrome [bacterium]